MIDLVRTLLAYDLIFAVLLAFFVLYQKNVAKTHKYLFGGYIFGAIVWISGVLAMFSYPTEVLYTDQDKLIYFFSKMAFWGPLIFFPCELWFIKTYPKKEIKLGSYFNLLPLGLALFLIIINAFDNTVFISFMIKEGGYGEGTLGPFQGLYSLFILTFYIYSFSLLYKKRKNTKELIIKKQFDYLFYSFIVFATLGMGTNWVLPAFFHTPFLSGLGPLTFLFVVACFLYSVTRYRFLDIKLSFQRYSTYLTNGLIYLFPLYGLHKIYSDQFTSFQIFGILVSGFFIFSLLTWEKTLPFFDRLFNYVYYRRSLNPIQEIQGSINGFHASVSDGLDSLTQAINSEGTQLAYVYNQGQHSVVGKEDFSHFTQYFSKNQSPELIKEEIEYELINLKSTKDSKKKRKLKALMDKYMIAAAIPVSDDNKKLLGILFLEEKVQGKLFSSQEIEAIKVLLEDATIYLMKEADYSKMKNQLKDKNKVKKEFIHGLMHEIKTPLTLACNVKDLIEWKKLTPKDQKFLDKAQERMFDLSNDMSKISEAFNWQNKFAEIGKSKTCLKKVIQYTLNILESTHPKTFDQVVIKAKKKEYMNTEIDVDFFNLQIAFSEIIKNGLFFNLQKENKKQVIVKIDQNQTQFILDFIDNGVGIERKNWESIFDLLHVLAYSRNRKEAGIGVGLTYARGIIETHKGSVSVQESKKNKGTTFRVIIPRD